ncbi:PilZ domain-containing protein [Bacillus sp. A301a_S52]|jgi:hypothetical protein|nr:PilZ domain-containing protein [Bacillus sp. A301a_S52]
MRYKRQEAMRCEFRHPLDTTFFISSLNGKPYRSSQAKGTILNASLGGLRLKTPLDLPVNKQLEVTFTFTIAHCFLTVQGRPLWKKRDENAFIYGIKLTTDTHEKDMLTALKAYNKCH